MCSPSCPLSAVLLGRLSLVYLRDRSRDLNDKIVVRDPITIQMSTKLHDESAIAPVLTARQLARFGDRLRDLRSRYPDEKLSLRELARRTGLSPTTIGELEQGLHEPRLGTILALRDGLGLGSIEELLGPMPSAIMSELAQGRGGDNG